MQQSNHISSFQNLTHSNKLVANALTLGFLGLDVHHALDALGLADVYKRQATGSAQSSSILMVG